jgi:hypothetical protein
MASQRIKATYSLDVETTQALEEMARRWKVSKSEALRRAIWAVAPEDAVSNDALSTLDELQERLALDPATANDWQTQVEQERRAFGAGSQRTGL